MHSPTALLILSLTLRALPVLSIVHSGPKPTNPTLNPPHSIGWSPKPTTAPIPKSPLELHRRRNVPINTCGWIDGNEDDPYWCIDGYACSTNLAGGYFGCCETDSVGNFLSADCAYVAAPYTGCYDYTSASACTGACYTENVVCDYSYPYCAMATMNVGFEILTNYQCSTEILDQVLDIETTVLFASSLGSNPTPITSATPETESTSIITTSSAAAPSSSTITTSSLTPSSSSSAPTPTPISKPSTSHAAGIAGGVVGGLAGLAAVLGGVIFLLHKRKQKQRQVVAPEISQTM